MTKPNFQNRFENFSPLEALRAIIRLSLDIFCLQKMREKQSKWFFSQLQFQVSGTAAAISAAGDSSSAKRVRPRVRQTYLIR